MHTEHTHYLDQSMLFRLFVSVDIIFIYAFPLFLWPDTLSISFYSILLLINEVLFLFFNKKYVLFLSLYWNCNECAPNWSEYTMFMRNLLSSSHISWNSFLLSFSSRASISHTHTYVIWFIYFTLCPADVCFCLFLPLQMTIKSLPFISIDSFVANGIHNNSKNQPVAENSIFPLDCLEMRSFFIFINTTQLFLSRILLDGEKNVQFYVGSCIILNERCHLIHADDNDDDNEDGNEKPTHKHTLQNVWAFNANRCVSKTASKKNRRYI